MRYAKGVGTAILLSAVTFNSCTCEKDLPPPPSASVKESAPGFHGVQTNTTPAPQNAQAPTATPAQPPEVAAAPTPTVVVNVPKDFPLPVFEGAAVAQVQSLANNAQNVIFRSSAATNELYNFYQDKLTHDGWNVTQEFQRGSHAFMSSKKGDMVANVTITEDPKNPGQQLLVVMYEHEKPLDFDDF
jgi:hypothetical protein